MSRQLTDAQETVAFEKNGLFIVKACPGSGKTFTVAARLNRLLAGWRDSHAGVAAISFTNVAWREIQDYLAGDFGMHVPLAYPHFLGTLDSFINQFIFLPFGHRVMGCDSRPELTGPPHNDSEPIGNWMYWRNAECNRFRCRLNDFSFGEDGTLIHLSPQSHFNNCGSNHQRCAALKQQFTAAGYATQADANYFAMQVLLEYPVVAEALARRFPSIIVDEAQDTSGIQMRILDALVDAGLSELMLVGDPYQAIYEWRQAEPRLFQDKFDLWQDNCVWLTENWRSTQSICNLACRLACSSGGIEARNHEIASVDHEPLLYSYGPESDLPALLENFKGHCDGLGIDPTRVSVLTRSADFLNAIVPGAGPQKRLYPWRDNDSLTLRVAHAKYLFDRGAIKEGLQRLERAAYAHLTGDSRCRRDDVAHYARSWGLGKWKGELFRLVSALPQSRCRLSDWLPVANDILAQSPVFPNPALAIKRDRGAKSYSELTFDDVFQRPEETEETQHAMFGTIHSAKGKSLDAVFLALKTRGAAGPHYVNLIGSTDLMDHEELRIVYVAVTRARKALAIAVPDAALDGWRQFLFPSVNV